MSRFYDKEAILLLPLITLPSTICLLNAHSVAGFSTRFSGKCASSFLSRHTFNSGLSALSIDGTGYGDDKDSATLNKSPFGSLLGLDDDDDVSEISRSRLPVGVIFDMDGTLLHQSIDFASMRQSIYAVANEDANVNERVDSGCVLEIAERLSPEGRAKAQEIFADIEKRAVEKMSFMDGLPDLLRYLDDHGVRRAVLTRNVESSVDTMHDRLWADHDLPPFFPALARDSKTEDSLRRQLPSKPDPEAIRYICDAVWRCDPAHVIMVGDSVTDDIHCANRAGCGASVLLKYQGKSLDNDSGNSDVIDLSGSNVEITKPTLVVEGLHILTKLFAKNGHAN